MLKRMFDVVVASLLLLASLPLQVVAAIWVRLDSRGPVLFRQERVGRFGTPFDILKFRTMVTARTLQGSLVTTASDDRITRAGAVLRKLKIDELPQLVNVLRGDMSLVGPRPEIQRFVDLYPVDVRAKILSVRPGITDPASILFRNESEIIDAAEDPESEYVNVVMPAKLKLYEEYVDNRSFGVDLMLLAKTAVSLFWRRKFSLHNG